MSTASTPRQERNPDTDDDVGNQNQFVTFAVAGEMFAVPMAPVQEIIRVPAVAHLPLAPRTLDGLANLRGRVLPIINLRRLFGCEERENDDATRALVINIGQALGFVVDRVASVVTIEPGEIESADSIQTVVNADYLTGVIKRARADGGHDMLLSIDFARLIEGQFSGIGAVGSSDRAASNAALGAQALADADEEHTSNDELRLVSFAVADQEYALDIAKVAKEMGILTVGVVTKPFDFEGPRRMKQADLGTTELEANVDSLIVVLNEKLLEVLGDDVTQDEAFACTPTTC